MSQDRRERLEELKGWVWDARAANWEDGYAKLAQYVEAEGNARVPRSYQTDDGYNLGSWVNEQRKNKNENKLSQDRRDRLEELKGWVWDARAANWEDGYAKLAQYVEAKEHTRVPTSYKTADGYPLGNWVTYQRITKDSMSQDRRDRLEGLKGWVWEVIR